MEHSSKELKRSQIETEIRVAVKRRQVNESRLSVMARQLKDTSDELKRIDGSRREKEIATNLGKWSFELKLITEGFVSTQKTIDNFWAQWRAVEDANL